MLNYYKNMIKNHKIIVAVHPDPAVRRAMVARIAVKLGLATIPSDALKIMKSDIADVNLCEAYFVLLSNYSFRGAIHTNQRLYELAVKGLAVVVACKTIPREYQFITQPIYKENLI